MKLLNVTFVSLAVLVSAVAGQSSLELLAKIPTCAQKCVLPILATLTSCNITTVPGLAACVCPNIPAQANMSTCVQEACSISDQFVVAGTNRDLCVDYPVPSRSQQLQVSCIVLMAVTIPFVILRCCSRLKIGMNFWWDDYMLLMSTAFFIATLSVVIPSSQSGLGTHVWYIQEDSVYLVLKLFYISEILYIFVVISTKISILFFYIRVFPQRWFKIVTYGAIAFVAMHGCVYLFVVTFQCTPVRAVWDLTLPRTCLNSQAIIVSAAASSIVEDLFILLLPIPNVFKLKLTIWKKISVLVVFCVGSFACVTSMVRLKYLTEIGQSTDTSWDNADYTIWSCIEMSVAIICACLPALRPLLAIIIPKVFSSFNTSAVKTSFQTDAKPADEKSKQSSADLENQDGNQEGTARLDSRTSWLDSPDYSVRRSLSNVSEEDTELVIMTPKNGRDKQLPAEPAVPAEAY